MSRQKKIVLGVIGFIVIVIVGIAAFMLGQRASNGTASSFRPGMMMGGGGGGKSGPSRLTAVSLKGSPVPSTNSGDAALPENSAAQKVGNLNVKLAIAPYPPVGFSQSTFTVTLTDEKGQAVSDAAISLDLTMPEMPMPTNVVSLKPGGSGVYESAGRFTMRGWWRIEAIIQLNGAKQSAFFDLGL